MATKRQVVATVIALFFVGGITLSFLHGKIRESFGTPEQGASHIQQIKQIKQMVSTTTDSGSEM